MTSRRSMLNASFEAQFAEIYRREASRCLATLVRVLGDIDLAQDAVADAFATAATHWVTNGIPPNPGAWITTTARNRGIDVARRESTRERRQSEAAALVAQDDPDPVSPADLGDLDVVPDDQLRLLFLCCHPTLAGSAQVALTLRLLGGLSTAEIAAAFLVPESTMAQRIVRVKRKIRDAELQYQIPDPEQLVQRMPAVLATIYLIFNEGYTASAGAELVRTDLTTEAIRLAKLLVGLLPQETEPKGLLALLVLTDSRRPARLDAAGNIVLLKDQDRALWDAGLIGEGQRLVRRCVELNRPGPYQYQAAIAAVHGDAHSAQQTDWEQIVLIYDQLFLAQPTAIVALNRGIALAEQKGPAAGLEAIEGLELEHYHLFHAARAEYLTQLGRIAEASWALEKALGLAENEVEVLHLQGQLDGLNDQSNTMTLTTSKWIRFGSD